MFLAILLNRKIAEIFIDFLCISFVQKTFVPERDLKIIRLELKTILECKPAIVRLLQSVSKCQIQIPKGGKS